MRSDVPALRKVYQAGHATAWQLYRALNPVYDESKWKSFVRRLGILSERHFLIRLVVDGMAAPVFALGDEGARSLAGPLAYGDRGRTARFQPRRPRPCVARCRAI